MIVLFTDEAEADLEAIGDYIARDNPSRAATFIKALRLDCDRLSEMPYGFSLVPRYEQHGIRRRIHGRYLIFYRIKNDRIEIVHVLNGAMDYGSILFEP